MQRKPQLSIVLHASYCADPEQRKRVGKPFLPIQATETVRIANQFGNVKT